MQPDDERPSRSWPKPGCQSPDLSAPCEPNMPSAPGWLPGSSLLNPNVGGKTLHPGGNVRLGFAAGLAGHPLVVSCPGAFRIPAGARTCQYTPTCRSFQQAWGELVGVPHRCIRQCSGLMFLGCLLLAANYTHSGSGTRARGLLTRVAQVFSHSQRGC